jgi:sortase (surface protein transpeptidase)
MPVTATGLNAQGGLALPDTSLEAVWFRHGAVPGELQDAALIAAHVDNRLTGIGPFARLSELDTGAAIAVTLSDGTVVEYTAVRRERVPKEQIDFAQIMSESAGMLLLVTCGGRFDTTTGHYEDNVIVWATPAEFSWSTP